MAEEKGLETKDFEKSTLDTKKQLFEFFYESCVSIYGTNFDRGLYDSLNNVWDQTFNSDGLEFSQFLFLKLTPIVKSVMNAAKNNLDVPTFNLEELKTVVYAIGVDSAIPLYQNLFTTKTLRGGVWPFTRSESKTEESKPPFVFFGKNATKNAKYGKQMFVLSLYLCILFTSYSHVKHLYVENVQTFANITKFSEETPVERNFENFVNLVENFSQYISKKLEQLISNNVGLLLNVDTQPETILNLNSVFVEQYTKVKEEVNNLLFLFIKCKEMLDFFTKVQNLPETEASDVQKEVLLNMINNVINCVLTDATTITTILNNLEEFDVMFQFLQVITIFRNTKSNVNSRLVWFYGKNNTQLQDTYLKTFGEIETKYTEIVSELKKEELNCSKCLEKINEFKKLIETFNSSLSMSNVLELDTSLNNLFDLVQNLNSKAQITAAEIAESTGASVSGLASVVGTAVSTAIRMSGTVLGAVLQSGKTSKPESKKETPTTPAPKKPSVPPAPSVATTDIAPASEVVPAPSVATTDIAPAPSVPPPAPSVATPDIAPAPRVPSPVLSASETPFGSGSSAPVFSFNKPDLPSVKSTGLKRPNATIDFGSFFPTAAASLPIPTGAALASSAPGPAAASLPIPTGAALASAPGPAAASLPIPTTATFGFGGVTAMGKTQTPTFGSRQEEKAAAASLPISTGATFGFGGVTAMGKTQTPTFGSRQEEKAAPTPATTASSASIPNPATAPTPTPAPASIPVPATASAPAPILPFTPVTSTQKQPPSTGTTFDFGSLTTMGKRPTLTFGSKVIPEEKAPAPDDSTPPTPAPAAAAAAASAASSASAASAASASQPEASATAPARLRNVLYNGTTCAESKEINESTEYLPNMFYTVEECNKVKEHLYSNLQKWNLFDTELSRSNYRGKLATQLNALKPNFYSTNMPPNLTNPELLVHAVRQLQFVFDEKPTVTIRNLLENPKKDYSTDEKNLKLVSQQIDRSLIVYYLESKGVDRNETKIVKIKKNNEKAPFFLFFTAGGERVYPLIPIIVDLSRANNDFAPGK